MRALRVNGAHLDLDERAKLTPGVSSGCPGHCSHSASLCHNRGRCIEQSGGYICDCTHSAYTGPSCKDGKRLSSISHLQSYCTTEQKIDVLCTVCNILNSLQFRLDSYALNLVIKAEHRAFAGTCCNLQHINVIKYLWSLFCRSKFYISTVRDQIRI